MDGLIKNLWLLLTLAIPGMTTYGTLRLLLVLYNCGIDQSAFEKMDSSAVLTTSSIVAIALAQQAIAISLEKSISCLCARCQSIDKKYYVFFCNRFRLAALGRLNEAATRIVGNFFTSVNVTIGQLMIFLYLSYRGLPFSHPAIVIVLTLAAANAISSWFRLSNATSILPPWEEEADKPGGAIQLINDSSQLRRTVASRATGKHS